MKNEKLCIDCTNMMNTKPMARCRASKYQDPVTGDDRRTCFVERLDGIGRCGILGNNFSPKTPVVVERKNPRKEAPKK